MLASRKLSYCAQVEDPQKRPSSVEYTLGDTLSAGLAMFSLKYSSLLRFDHSARLDEPVRHNLRTLHGVEKVPCDTQLRSILDPVALRPAFRALHRTLQRGQALADYAYFDDAYLLSIDGTGQFASSGVSCAHCCVKQTKGGLEYYH